MTCPRCGRAQPGEAGGPFCAHCGQFLVPMRWVASPPPADPSRPGTRPVPRQPYAGPPRYRNTPTWGYPALPWQRAGSEAESRPPVEVLLGQAGLLVPMLRGLAVLAVLSAFAEGWRYVLLLRSRTSALNAREVAASDALVGAASWVTVLLTVAVGFLLLRWVLGALRASAARTGRLPARSARTVVLGWLVPGANIAVPGSVMAEIEHAALDRPPGQRPTPSTLVRVWWGLWASNVVLGLVSVGWLLREGAQARADGVVQHALLDLVVAATAVVTARLVTELTALIAPPRVVPLPRVVRVSAPAASTVSPR
ncbi:MAG: DUF4328 domain-containing protein [Pseudonocardia sp.]